MWTQLFGDLSDSLVPLAVLAIPVVAIIGGITAGIVKTISEGRIVENAQRERIAAIQAGIDPAKLPPLPARTGGDLDPGVLTTPAASFEYVARRRAWGLLTGGLVCLFTGIGLALFLYFIGAEDGNAWAIGLVPGSVGVALLLSWLIVRPRNAR